MNNLIPADDVGLEAVRKLLQGGDADGAARRLADLCRQTPSHSEALHLLGIAQMQMGKADTAEQTLAAAIALQPMHFKALSNRGLALHTLGRFQAALACFDQALTIEPDFANAHNNRGGALRSLDQQEEALLCFDRALALQGGHVDALKNRAEALKNLGRLPEALASYEHLAVILPASVDVMIDLGNALFEMDRFEDALARFDAGVALAPDRVAVWVNRGAALAALGQGMAAQTSFEEALRCQPENPEALCNLGHTMVEQRRLDEALENYDHALVINPKHVKAKIMRAKVLFHLQRYSEAVTDFRKVLAIEPLHVEALSNLGQAYDAMERTEDAIKTYATLLAVRPDYPYLRGNEMACRLKLCDWRDFDIRLEALKLAVLAGRRAIPPFMLMGMTDDATLQLICARQFAAEACTKTLLELPQREEVCLQSRRLRLAYVSSDFRNHAVASLISEIIELHDKESFEVIGVSLMAADETSPDRIRLRAAFDQFIEVDVETDRQVATRLRDMQLDIVVDLNGYTTHSRPGIFGRRPAPIQVNFIGYPGSMGLPVMDYIIADRRLIPPDHEQFYTEKAACMPDTFQPNDTQRTIWSGTPRRDEVDLPPKGIVFCAFNNSYKILPSMFDVWMRILRRVEGSVLWVLGGASRLQRNLRREAENRGVHPDRLVFAARMQAPLYRARYRAADLFLDTVPFNGGTTVSDALWAGLPVLTCTGQSFVGRMATSLLTAAKLPELITSSLNDYEEAAVRLAKRPSELAELRNRLRANPLKLPLFDSLNYTHHLEDAYRMMWQRYCRGEVPASFDVPAKPARVTTD